MNLYRTRTANVATQFSNREAKNAPPELDDREGTSPSFLPVMDQLISAIAQVVISAIAQGKVQNASRN